MENKLISELNETYDYLSSDDELYHHGVLGMKWGVRRFQPYSLIPRKSGKGGKETGAAKKSKSKKSVVKKGAAVKKAVVKKSRKVKQEIEKAKKVSEAQTARQRKEAAQKVLRSGDAKSIYENRDSFTTQQLNDAINRINTEAALKSLVAAQNPTKGQKLKKTLNKVVNPENLQKTADFIEKGANLYNQTARVANLMRDSEHQLKYIGKAENKDKNKVVSAAARKIINTGDPVAILQNQGRLNDAEIEAAKNRLNNLASIRSQEKGIEKHYREMENERRTTAKQKKQHREEDLQYLRDSIKTNQKYEETDSVTFSPFDPTTDNMDNYDNYTNNKVRKKLNHSEASVSELYHSVIYDYLNI